MKQEQLPKKRVWKKINGSTILFMETNEKSFLVVKFKKNKVYCETVHWNTTVNVLKRKIAAKQKKKMLTKLFCAINADKNSLRLKMSTTTYMYPYLNENESNQFVKQLIFSYIGKATRIFRRNYLLEGRKNCFGTF